MNEYCLIKSWLGNCNENEHHLNTFTWKRLLRIMSGRAVGLCSLRSQRLWAVEIDATSYRSVLSSLFLLSRIVLALLLLQQGNTPQRHNMNIIATMMITTAIAITHGCQTSLPTGSEKVFNSHFSWYHNVVNMKFIHFRKLLWVHI